MRKEKERMEKQMNEIQNENRRMKEPLERVKEELAVLQKQLANYEKDKETLRVSTGPLKNLKILGYISHMFSFIIDIYHLMLNEQQSL